jgi:hypothetical protein
VLQDFVIGVSTNQLGATTFRARGFFAPARVRLQVCTVVLRQPTRGGFNRGDVGSVERLATMLEQLPSVVSLAAPPAPGHGLAPAGLWKAVVRARADLAHQRHLSQRHLEPSARVTLVEALESYVESLAERGHPVPYPLRDELRLQRLTCVASRGVTMR